MKFIDSNIQFIEIELLVNKTHIDPLAIVNSSFEFVQCNLCRLFVKEFSEDAANFGSKPLLTVPDDLETLKVRDWGQLLLHIFLKFSVRIMG